MSVITETLADLASNALLRTTTVTRVHRPTPEFVRVELQADAFRATSWTPGAKLQLRPRRGTFAFRTYTPTRWDAERGVTELVAFTHGEGPAADWFREVSVGDACEVFGPRRSVELGRLSGDVLFVGDESSVGLACALRTVTARANYVFEAVDPVTLRKLLDELDFDHSATVVVTSPDRAELLERARASAAANPPEFDLLVTGEAGTVHAVRRDSRAWAQRPRRVTGKAYWAPGRTGLD